MDALTIEVPVALMAKYNLWATDCFVGYFKAVPEATMRQHYPSSFPSLYHTLLHILNAQEIWYQRLHGKSPAQFPARNPELSPAELLNALVSSSEQFVALCTSCDSAALAEEIAYSTMSSGPQNNRRFEILLHVFNHSMYHRGQCITMARGLGLTDPPPTDLIRFLRL